MIIMGIDPGLGCTGVAIIQDNRNILHSQMITSKIKDPIEIRLLQILTEVVEIIDNYDFWMEVAIEDQFVGKNLKTSLKIAMAKSSAMMAAAYRGMRVTTYTPTCVKKIICKNGNADKQEVRNQVEKIYNDKVIGSNDVSDAIAVAYCHWAHVQKL